MRSYSRPLPLQFAGRNWLTNTPKMCVEPIRNQRGIRFPSGVRMSNAFAHSESGGHVSVIQTLDEPMRLLNRYGFILVTVNQNCWRIASGHMRHRRILPQHPDYLLPRRE